MTQIHRHPSSTRGLVAYQVALELAGAIRPLLPLLERWDASLADQVRRAVVSVPLNLAEAKRRTGRDRAHLLAVALGSASEVRAALEVAVALGAIDPGATAEALALTDRVNALLFGLRRQVG